MQCIPCDAVVQLKPCDAGLVSVSANVVDWLRSMLLMPCGAVLHAACACLVLRWCMQLMDNRTLVETLCLQGFSKAMLCQIGHWPARGTSCIVALRGTCHIYVL